MNTAIKNIDLDAFNLMPVTEFDDEANCLPAAIITKRAIVAPLPRNLAVNNRSATERNSAFRRVMSAVKTFWKPNQESSRHVDIAPGAEIPEPRTYIKPAHDTDIAIKSPQQLRTLYYLLHADDKGLPISEFKHLVGAANPGDPVSKLNRKVGHYFIKTTDYPVTNKTGKTTERANYWLTAEGKRIASKILTNSGYVHDEKSNGHHLNRPGMVAADFIAGAAIDADDLLVLRDGTEPQWLRLVYLLRAANGKWVPRYVADELLDSCNVRQVVRVANERVGGVAIESTTRTMLNRDDGACDYGLYRIGDDWADKVDKVIKDKLASARKAVK